jgi:hypothetical protein
MPFFAALGTALGASAASAATVGAVATAGLAATGAGLGYTIASGESAKNAQEKALRQQTQEQNRLAAQAAMQQRRSEQAIAGAQRREPNVQAIMAGAQEAATGPTSTMLTGPTGVNPQDLALGRSTLLGG